jgi:hypothetical protein
MGKMSRELTLSNVLHGLEVSKVHFRVRAGKKGSGVALNKTYKVY